VEAEVLAAVEAGVAERAAGRAIARR